MAIGLARGEHLYRRRSMIRADRAGDGVEECALAVGAGAVEEKQRMLLDRAGDAITDDALQVRESNAESKAVHVLTVQVRADKTGELNRTIRVITDLPDNGEIEFHATAQVVK